MAKPAWRLRQFVMVVVLLAAFHESGWTQQALFRYELPAGDPYNIDVHFLVGGAVQTLNATLSAEIRIREPLSVVVRFCAVPHLDLERSLVVYCLDAGWQMLWVRADGTRPPFSHFEANEGIQFTLLHELAHALVVIHDIPIVGDEEAAIDELAALFLLEILRHRVVQSAITMLRWYGDQESEETISTHHGPSSRRAARLECTLVGKSGSQIESILQNRESLGESGDDYWLGQRGQYIRQIGSEERYLECSRGFAEANGRWRRLLDGVWMPKER